MFMAFGCITYFYISAQLLIKNKLVDKINSLTFVEKIQTFQNFKNIYIWKNFNIFEGEKRRPAPSTDANTNFVLIGISFDE